MTTSVFAVSDAAEGSAGAVVYWRLSGTVDPDQLAAAWETAGLDRASLPELPAPRTALARAVKALQKDRTLVRPLEDRADGYAVVREVAHGDELTYATTLRVKLDAVARLVLTPADHPLAPTLAAAYTLALNEFDTTDLTPWLVRLLFKRCAATALRDQGGVYYVPPTCMAEWDAVTQAVRAASTHKFFRIPALSSRDVLDAVLDAVEQEAAAEVEAMEKELTAATGDGGKGISGRVGAARVGRCDAVEKKVALYERMLGTRLEAVRASLDSLRSNFTTAMLAAAAPAPEGE